MRRVMSDGSLRWLFPKPRTGVPIPWGSLLVLALVNQAPVWGVIFRDWSVFTIMLLFALENIIIGAFNLLRMRMVPTRAKTAQMLLFVFHYGTFTLAHIAFVFMLFGQDVLAALDNTDNPLKFFREVFGIITVWLNPLSDLGNGLWVPVLGMLISHGTSFWKDFLGQQEYKRTSFGFLVFHPYGRVAVMHATTVIGAVIVEFTGSHVAVLVLLVWLKTVLDIRAHLMEKMGLVERMPRIPVQRWCKAKGCMFGEVMFHLPWCDNPAEQQQILDEAKAQCRKCSTTYHIRDFLDEYPALPEPE